MRTQIVQFPRFPGVQAQRTVRGGPAWGRRWLLSLAGSAACVLGGAAYWSLQREPAAGLSVAGLLIVAGLGLALVSVVCLFAWFRGVLRGSQRPWGRLMLVGLVASWVLEKVAEQQHAFAWSAVLSDVQGILLIGLVARLFTRGRRPTAQDETARWEAGALGEGIVSQTLAQLESDHVIIHNLPIPGCGDADHVVVGPAGVMVIESKYLAGRISCLSDGRWMQIKRDHVRQIADPAAQVQRVAAAVEAKLRRAGWWDVPVHVVLVLAHPHAELDVQRSSVPVVRPFEVVPLLRRLEYNQAGLDASAVAAVANAVLNGRESPGGSQQRGGHARV